jgi:hypothetical protein
MVDPLNRQRNEDKTGQMNSRNLARRLERLETELAPPADPEMMELCFRALVDGEIISRFLIPRDPPKRGWRRHRSQNAGGDTSFWNADRNDELTAPPRAEAAR